MRGPLSALVDRIPPEWQDRIVTAATVYATVQYGPVAGDVAKTVLTYLMGGS